jgi:hypothetical protein
MCPRGCVLVMWGDTMRELFCEGRVRRSSDLFYRVKYILSTFQMKKVKWYYSIRSSVRFILFEVV